MAEEYSSKVSATATRSRAEVSKAITSLLAAKHALIEIDNYAERAGTLTADIQTLTLAEVVLSNWLLGRHLRPARTMHVVTSTEAMVGLVLEL